MRSLVASCGAFVAVLFLAGSSAWCERPDPSALLVVGALLQGSGRVWADDLALFVDGKPLVQAPEVVLEKTVLDTDHEFDNGSKITVTHVTQAQAQNLFTLAKVWGFLKYHHPAVTGGKLQWDYELFRILPAVLEARDRGAANQVLGAWVEHLGEVPPVPRLCRTAQGQSGHASRRLDRRSRAAREGSRGTAAVDPHEPAEARRAVLHCIRARGPQSGSLA
jgi:hypothetical protein